MAKYWFERNWKNEGEELDRRQKQNRLRRIAEEAHDQEDGLIEHWLDLAKRIFDGDDDPDPQAT
jgi:hypothetical protein